MADDYNYDFDWDVDFDDSFLDDDFSFGLGEDTGSSNYFGIDYDSPYNSGDFGTDDWNFDFDTTFDTQASQAPAEESSFWGGLGDWASSREGMQGILGAGAGLFSAYNQKEQRDYAREQSEQALALKREDQKFAALIELAKLKYAPQRGGSGGGGGGSASRRNELMISALQRGADDKVSALNALAQNYGQAVTSGRER